MDWQLLASWAVPVLAMAIGYCIREYRQLEKSFNDFKVKVAEEYVTTHDLGDIKADIKLILAKMDGKADKAHRL
jgi:phage host-nuclease inhibitor protein Gam